MIDNHFKANDLQIFSKDTQKGETEKVNATDIGSNPTMAEFESMGNGQKIKKNTPLALGRKSKLSSAKKFFKFLKIGKKKKHKQSDDVANPNPNKNNSLEKQSKTDESNEGNIPVSSIESNKIESLDDKIADYTNFLEKLKEELGDIPCLQRLSEEFEKLKANGNFDKSYSQVKEDAQKQVQAVRSFVSLIKDFEKEYGEKNVPRCLYQKLEKCREEGKGELVYDQAKSLVENTRDYSDLIDKLKFKYGADSVPKSLYEKLEQYREFGSKDEISPKVKIHVENLVKNTKAFTDLVNELKIKYGEKNIPDSVLDKLKQYKEFGREKEISAKTIKWAKYEVLKSINKNNGAYGEFIIELEKKYGRHNIPECLYKNIDEEEKGSILDKTKSEAENLVKNAKDFSKLISRLEENYGKENVPQNFYEELAKCKQEGKKEPISPEVSGKMENLVKNTKDYADLVYELGQEYGWSNIPKYMLENLETYRKEGREDSVDLGIILRDYESKSSGKISGDPTISDDFERLDPMYDSTHDEIENPLFNSQLEAKDYDPFDEPFDDDDV